MTVSTTIDLQSAADRLGVHYQTAYKWVRSGALPARIVRGRYVLDSDDVARFDAERSQPAPPPPRRPRRGFPAVVDDVLDRLLDGDERSVRRIVGGLAETGVASTTVAQEVLAPALREIGQRWAEGTLSIATEHRATALVERLLADLVPNPRGRRRGIAVVASVSGDRHAVATTMAALALRDDNWQVQHLGADVPGEEIAAFSRGCDADLVVLSVTTRAAAADAEALAAELRDEGRRVLVGSPGSTLEDLQAAARGD